MARGETWYADVPFTDTSNVFQVGGRGVSQLDLSEAEAPGNQLKAPTPEEITKALNENPSFKRLTPETVRNTMLKACVAAAWTTSAGKAPEESAVAAIVKKAEADAKDAAEVEAKADGDTPVLRLGEHKTNCEITTKAVQALLRKLSKGGAPVTAALDARFKGLEDQLASLTSLIKSVVIDKLSPTQPQKQAVEEAGMTSMTADGKCLYEASGTGLALVGGANLDALGDAASMVAEAKECITKNICSMSDLVSKNWVGSETASDREK